MKPTVEVDNTNQTQDISSGNDVESGLVSEIETKTYREEIYQQSLDILQALGYEPSEKDGIILQFCTDTAIERACRFCNTTEPPQATSVLVRMTLGEFLTCLRGASRSFALAQGTGGEVKTIKEGDVSITYETGTSDAGTVSSDSLISSFCNAIEELTAERRLSW